MASHKFVNIDNLEQVWKRLDEKIEKELKSEGVNSINGITGTPIITGDEYLNVSNDDKTISIVPTNKIKNTITAIEEGGAADADGKYHIIKSVNGKAVEAMVDETGIVVNNDITIDARDIKVAEEGNMYDQNGYETIQEALDGINIKISELADVSDELVKKDMTIGESINNIVDEISINEYQTQLSLNKKATHHEITKQFFTSDPLLKQEIKEGDTIHLQKTIYTTQVVQWLASGNALYTRGYMNEGDTEFSVYTNPNLNSESTIGNRWICGVDDSGTYIYDQYGEHDLGFTKFYGNELFKNTSYANLIQKAGFYIMAHKDGNSYKLIEQKNINISGDDYISVKEDESNFKINFSNNLTADDINYDESTTVVEILDTLIEENKPKYIEISSQSDLEEALNDENNIGYIFYVTNAPIASGIYIKTSNGLFKINGEFV